MIAGSYSNVTNLPIFGYGATTAAVAPQATSLFPLTRKIRNPFVANDIQVIKDVYTDCLNSIEMSMPCYLNSILMFFKALGTHCRTSLLKRAKTTPAIKLSADSFYVLYVLSSGLIMDMQECIKILSTSDWQVLPVQIQLIFFNKDSENIELE